MADKKISQLDSASALTGSETFPLVQSGTTKKGSINQISNFLTPTSILVEKDVDVDLADSQYANIQLVKLSWSGGAGNMTLTLPSASSSQNRAIRFISNDGFNTNTRVYLTPAGSDTIDGSTNYYEINKQYEGIYIWSDGQEWFIIQKKA